MPRATPLPADERRAAILAATEPLLEQWGRDVSTKQIAEAAGIAEGTIFRVFPTKEALIEAVATEAFDMGLTCAELAQIDLGLELEARLVRAVEVLQRRMRRVIALFHALRFRPPPDEDRAQRTRDDNELLGAALTALIGPDAHRLRVPPAEAAQYIRCLTFATSHPMLAGPTYTPDQLVDRVLRGIATPNSATGPAAPTSPTRIPATVTKGPR